MMTADPSSMVLAHLLPRVVEYVNFWQAIINDISNSKPGDILEFESRMSRKFFD
jgi:hypothetical protein